MRISDWSSDVCSSDLLTSFVGDTLRGKDDVLALASNSRRKSGLAHLHQTLAQLFAAGVDFEQARLFAHRSIREMALIGTPTDTAKHIGRASCRERVCTFM